MKATINGKTYDTENADNIANYPSPDGDDELYRTSDGEFFLETGSTFLDGRKLEPWENPFELAPELAGLEDARQRKGRLRCERCIVPISTREALVWCIKTQIPECFRGVLLESL